jgi:hypothetical protein
MTASDRTAIEGLSIAGVLYLDKVRKSWRRTREVGGPHNGRKQIHLPPNNRASLKLGCRS